MQELSGKLIEFIDEQKLKFALVKKQNGEKLLLSNSRGKDEKKNIKSVINIYHSPLPGSLLDDEIKTVVAKINGTMSDIDIEFVWESFSPDGIDLEIDFMTKEYFGDVDNIKKSALFRVLLKDHIFFKYKGGLFSVRDISFIQEQKERDIKKKEQADFNKRALVWLSDLQDIQNENSPVSVPKEMNVVLKDIEQYLFEKRNSDVVSILGQIKKDRNILDVAVDLLKKSGKLSADADSFLASSGIRSDFRNSVLEKADSLKSFVKSDDYLDLTSLRAFSVDDDDTKEIDDAFTYEDKGDRIVIGIHIADVSYFVGVGDAIDREAYNRTISLYLPSGMVPMLPLRVGCNLASLNKGDPSPSLSLLIEFDKDGKMLDYDFTLALIKISDRLNYDDVDRFLSGEYGVDEDFLFFKTMNSFAKLMLKQRNQNGAISINRPELKLKVDGDDISCLSIDTKSLSRNLVAEYMILYNKLAAEYAYSNSIPVIYRCQDQPDLDVKSLSLSDEYDPVEIDSVLKTFKPSRITLYPTAHACLGLERYVQLSSPLRRYSDLIIQRQFKAYFKKNDFPYEGNELMKILATVEVTSREIKGVERKAKRYWSMKFLEKYKQQEPLVAVVLGKIGSGYNVELVDYYIRGTLIDNGSHNVGERVDVIIDKVTPSKNFLRFKLK